MNSNERLAKAIETGVPVPGTPEQARELVAQENVFAARMARDIVRCAKCGKLGPRDTDSLIADTGVCVCCGRAYDERQRQMEFMTDALIDERKTPGYESREDRDAEREYRQMRMGGRF